MFPEEADEALRENTEKLWNKLSDGQKMSLYKYIQDSDPFNNTLRGYNKKPSNNEKLFISNMTEAISKSSLKDNVWLNRGIGTRQGTASFLGVSEDWLENATSEDLQKLVGKVVTDKGFISCSSIEEGVFGGSQMNVMCPAGTRAIYAEPFSRSGGGEYEYQKSVKVKALGETEKLWNGKEKQSTYVENEVIIQRETSFVITKINKLDADKWGKWKVEFECMVIGQKY